MAKTNSGKVEERKSKSKQGGVSLAVVDRLPNVTQLQLKEERAPLGGLLKMSNGGKLEVEGTR